MARSHYVKSSRKEHTCGRGGHVIPAGDAYYWAKPGFRRRTPLIRCSQHPFRPSELTTSERSAPMSAVEQFEDAAAQGFESIADLEQAWDELKSAVEEYQQNREYALEQWEHGNSQLEDLLETAQRALEEVEGWTPEEFTEDEPDRSGWPESDEGQDEYDTAWEEWDESRRRHIEDQTDQALETAGSLEF